MRYIIAQKDHTCSVCKKIILQGKICIQSTARIYLMYHEECHARRFQDSPWHRPTNDRPEQNNWGDING